MRIVGVDNFYIELVEEYPCENLEQLRKREGQFIREFGTLNHQIAGRTKQEYAQDTRDHKRQVDRQYYQDHHEEQLEHRREYYKKNKDHINESNRLKYQENKEQVLQRNKGYYNTHKEQVLQQQKKYVDDNREKVKQWKSTKILCSCGIEYTQSHQSSHMKTLRHKQLMEQQQSTGDPERRQNISYHRIIKIL